MPELFLILVVVFLGAPVARAIAKSIEHRTLPPGNPDPELRKALQVAEQRLSDSETRIAALEERVDFYEKLLANPSSTATSSSEAEPPSHQS